VLLLGGVSLAFLLPQWLRPITTKLSPRAVVAAALLLMALSLESRSLVGSLLRPLPALWAVIISYGLLPAVGLLAGKLVPNDNLRLGVLIITSVPCTLASAVLWTRLAGGNEATALLVTLLTTATSWLATTAWLTQGTGVAVSVDAAAMMQGLVFVLLVPVGLGQLSRMIPMLVRAASRYRAVLGVVSRLLILCIVLKATVDVRDRLSASTSAIAVWPFVVTLGLCLGIHLLALLLGLGSSRLFGFGRSNQIAVAFACSQKTLPVALYLFDTYFVIEYPLAVVPLVFYHVGQLLLDTVIAERLARPLGVAPAWGKGGEQRGVDASPPISDSE
jgi:solute carrier family 10 (sodium/bile acid cotransporter), member 7